MHWTADLARPAPIVAALVLALNDHVLKGGGVVPGWLTGKLSDVSGLFVATILAVTVARAVVRAATGRQVARDGWLAASVAIAIALAFCALKLSTAFNTAVERAWGVNRLDASDLWTLPAIALAWLWLGDRERAASDVRARGFVGGVALVGIVLACAATPAPPPVPPRPVPGWTLRDATIALPCGEATAWVSKAGKSGFGLTVRVTPRSSPCTLKITAARTRFASGPPVVGRELAVVQSLAARNDAARRELSTSQALASPHYHYVAFEHDSNARWNRGDRSAHVELEIAAGGAHTRWVMAATHDFITFSARRPR